MDQALAGIRKWENSKLSKSRDSHSKSSLFDSFHVCDLNPSLAMETHFPDSPQLGLSLPTHFDSAAEWQQKAWHLLALIFQIGRSCSPHELASRCTLFPASPDLIEYLCFLPNSPVTLIKKRGDLFVTISLQGFTALQNFAFCMSLNLTGVLASSIVTRNGLIWNNFSSRKCFPMKRKLFDLNFVEDYNEESTMVVYKKSRHTSAEENLPRTESIDSRMVWWHCDVPVAINEMLITPYLFSEPSNGFPSCKRKTVDKLENEMSKRIVVYKRARKEMLTSDLDNALATVLGSQIACIKNGIEEMHLGCQTSIDVTTCAEDKIYSHSSTVDAAKLTDDGCNALVNSVQHIETMDILNESIVDYMIYNGKLSFLDQDPMDSKVHEQAIFMETDYSITQKQLPKPSTRTKSIMRSEGALKQQAAGKPLDQPKPDDNTFTETQYFERENVSTSKVKMVKQNYNKFVKNEASALLKDQGESKKVPNFKSYAIEEKEGSGGYGTVYRARRKKDGATVAIKCPHAKAHRHHVDNELNMLEKFGGRNFVIKYEGCIKSGDLDCLVLEHVQHDRPEALKKEIGLLQLQWYGYCMFRALSSLHKQGVVHRDVKPGNFLFSCKANRGYLIDFNLAMDLHQRYGSSSIIKVGNVLSFDRVTPTNIKNAPPTPRMLQSCKLSGPVHLEATKGCKSSLESKKLKKKVVDETKAVKSQIGDGSGVTSVKEGTASTKTHSVEKRPREPLPCQGRKELLSLLHQRMESPIGETLCSPAPMRKRVAANPGNMDVKSLYLTPMPLQATDLVVVGSGSRKSKGDNKHKKEGPCAGTKGFRAPEVLFRSPHQGPKIDIWSAGVSLLFLMLGRTPFYGDPEENIKDIAKLRGSEELWEVAKLHGRECSFPKELYDANKLPCMGLRDWYKMNTKRKELVDLIPASLFDLVDKCLAVNPRRRISAEEALNHEFFAPCHDDRVRNKRMRSLEKTCKQT